MRFMGWFLGLFGKWSKPVYAASGPKVSDDQDIPMPECDHPKATEPTVITVKGEKIKYDLGAKICPRCAEDWLSQASTVCAKCNGIIVPGMPVGQAWIGAKHPYTHFISDCCEVGALYCGLWGAGRLVTLHELNPERYPTGTGSVLSHVAKTCETVTERPQGR
jgi:hypothetical protein